MDPTNYPEPAVEHRVFPQQPHAGVDCAFDRFRAATKRRPGFVGNHDEHARAELRELAESSDALANEQQRLLSAQTPLRAPNLKPVDRLWASGVPTKYALAIRRRGSFPEFTALQTQAGAPSRKFLRTLQRQGHWGG